MTGSNRLARAPLRVFALSIRIARALGLTAHWTFPSRANRVIARSGLFDPRAYLQAYPHAGLGVLSPLDHFMAHGARAGHDPDPYFSVTWYLANNPDVARAGVNPLLHYIRAGEREGRAPSRLFDPGFYAAHSPDVTTGGGALLAHFLAHGRAEGRLPKAPDPECAPEAALAGEADIAVVKTARVSPGEAVVLLAGHAPAGRLMAHTLAYIDALRAAGRKVVVVALAGAPFDAPPGLLDCLTGLYVRERVGCDFAAWAHVLQIEPSLYAAGSLLLADDSVLPCADVSRIARLLGAMEAHPNDIVGLTERYDAGWHIERYAMLLKPAALRNAALQRFMLAVRSLPDTALIETYELRFAADMRAAALTVGVLFRAPTQGDRTPVGWRDLLKRGFPLVKLAVLGDRDAWPATGDGYRELAAHGFDPDLARRAVAAAPPAGVDPQGGLLTEGMAQAALAADRPLSVDYLGPWNLAGEQGAASRSLVSALWRTPFRLNIRSVRTALAAPAGVVPTVDATDVSEPADVAIVHLESDGSAQMSEDQRRRFDRAGLRVGVWTQASEPPAPAGLDPCATVDAVWAPSRACADAIVQAARGRPVHVVPLAPDATADAPSLDRLGRAMHDSLLALTGRRS